MNRSQITTRIGLTLGTLGLAMLGACGGGGGAEPALASVPATELATGAAVATLCGVQTAPAPGTPYSVNSQQPVVKDGLTTLYSTVTSLTGSTDASHTVSLDLPMEDMREVPEFGHAPVQTFDTMSVEMGSGFKAGSVGCIHSVARLIPIETAGNTSYLLSWKSDTLDALPLSASRSEPLEINGFEFVNNFDTVSGTAVFRMDMRYLATSADVQVCRATSSATRVCSTPSVSNDGAHWTFRLPITQAGVYFLIAPRETPI